MAMAHKVLCVIWRDGAPWLLVDPMPDSVPMPRSVPPWQMGAYIGTIRLLMVPGRAAATGNEGILMHSLGHRLVHGAASQWHQA